ncbi:MAG: DUF1844 domain-containing protein [Myxococcales bacterium]|nr:DUF1844 domain-containing protein [Myxococcales bacterium]
MTAASDMGPVDFSMHIVSLGSSAMVSMGKVPAPAGEEIAKDLHTARFLIDVLAMLQTKTKGNLTENEDALLQRLLHDLRVAFLDAAK